MIQEGITKNQSKALKGLAVLLLLYHHFFMSPYTYGEGLSFFNIDIVEKSAWFCKICVGMFAFISGYGMCRVMGKLSADRLWNSIKLRYRKVIKSIIGLLIRFWIITLVFYVTNLIAGIRNWDIFELGKNMLCISTSFNGANWYVEQYAKMLLILPLLDMFFTRLSDKKSETVRRIIYIILILIGLWLLLAQRDIIHMLNDFFRFMFLYCFIVGYLIARFKIYEIIGKVVERLGSFRLLVGLILISAVIYIRVQLAVDAAYASYDYVLVPFFIYGALLILTVIKPLETGLAWVGEQSTYMWLTHVYIFDLTSRLLCSFISSHLLFYIVQVLLALLLAMALNFIDAKCRCFLSALHLPSLR